MRGLQQLALAGSFLCGSPLVQDDTATELVQEPPKPDLDARYKQVSFPLEGFSQPAWNHLVGYREFVLQLGRFEGAMAGESVELLALRAGIDPTLLCRTHGIDPGHTFAEDETVCIELHHLLLPDESLEDLARLHECSLETLLALNELDGSQPASPWSMLRVPARFTEGPGARRLRVAYPDVPTVHGRGATIVLGSGRFVTHQVAQGETWESIATEYGVDARALELAQRIPAPFLEAPDLEAPENVPVAHPAPVAGRRIVVLSEMAMDPEASVIELALSIQSICWQLPRVLRLNGVERPEELVGRRSLRLPLNVTTVQFSHHDDE